MALDVAASDRSQSDLLNAPDGISKTIIEKIKLEIQRQKGNVVRLRILDFQLTREEEETLKNKQRDFDAALAAAKLLAFREYLKDFIIDFRLEVSKAADAINQEINHLKGHGFKDSHPIIKEYRSYRDEVLDYNETLNEAASVVNNSASSANGLNTVNQTLNQQAHWFSRLLQTVQNFRKGKANAAHNAASSAPTSQTGNTGAAASAGTVPKAGTTTSSPSKSSSSKTDNILGMYGVKPATGKGGDDLATGKDDEKREGKGEGKREGEDEKEDEAMKKASHPPLPEP